MSIRPESKELLEGALDEIKKAFIEKKEHHERLQREADQVKAEMDALKAQRDAVQLDIA